MPWEVRSKPLGPEGRGNVMENVTESGDSCNFVILSLETAVDMGNIPEKARMRLQRFWPAGRGQ